MQVIIFNDVISYLTNLNVLYFYHDTGITVFVL